jgi:hypothetical protein
MLHKSSLCLRIHPVTYFLHETEVPNMLLSDYLEQFLGDEDNIMDLSDG